MLFGKDRTHMKRITTWVLIIALIIFIIDWGIIGVKLLDGNYDIITEAYIGAACFGVMLISAVYKAFASKCPHGGKMIQSNGKYCPHCGKEI